MKNQLLPIIYLLFSSIGSNAQMTFQRSIGTDGNDRNYSIDKTHDGGYITAGFTENFSGTLDIYVVKTDPYGNIEWSNTISNSDNQRAWKIRSAKNGGYLLAGSSTHFGNKEKAFIIKLNGLGMIVWQTFFEDTEDVAFYGLAETKSGSIIATGLRKTAAGAFDIFIGKVYSNGTIAFANAYENQGNQEGFNIIEDANGHYVATGWFNNSTTSNLNRVMLVKVDSSGNHLNTLATAIRSSPTPGSGLIAIRGYDLIQSGRHYYVAGWESVSSVNKVDTAFQNAQIANSFQNGNEVYLLNSANTAFNIKEGLDNNLLVAGYTQSGNFGGRDAWLMKMSKSGQGIWAKNYGGNQVDGHWPTEVVIEADKTYSLLSSTNSFGLNGSYDFYMIKTDFNGNSTCNSANMSNSVSQAPYVEFSFHNPLSVFNASISSYSLNDTFRTGSVQKLCCRVKAISASSMSVCISNTIPLGFDSLQGYKYEWTSNGVLFSTKANPTFQIQEGFTSKSFKLKVYTLESTCGSDSTQFTLTLNPRPNRSFVRTNEICQGDSFFVAAPMGSTNLTWTGPNTNSNGFSLYLKQSGTYILSFRSGVCQYEDTIDLIVNPKPFFNLKDTVFCAGKTIEVKGPSGMQAYNWNGQGNSSDSIKSFFLPGNQTLEVTNDFGCKHLDTFVITHYLLPPAFSLQNQGDSLCSNKTRLLLGPIYPNHTYNWNLGLSNMKDVVAEPNTMYRLDITNANGCVRTDSVFIPSKLAPEIISDRVEEFCLPDLLIISSNPGLQYKWDGIDGDSTYAYTGQDSVVLERIAENGCSETTVFTFVQKPDPVFSLGEDTLICHDDSLLLLGPSAMSAYLWNTGNTSQDLLVKTKGEYSLMVTATNGCSFSDTISVDTLFCEHESVATLKLQSIKVYPNPSSGWFEIEIPMNHRGESVPFVVTDMNGKEVKSGVIDSNSNSYSLDMTENVSGVYFIRLNNNWIAKLILLN